MKHRTLLALFGQLPEHSPTVCQPAPEICSAMTDMAESGAGILKVCAEFNDQEVDDLIAFEMAVLKSVRQQTLAAMGEEAAIYVFSRLGLQPFAEIYFFLNIQDAANCYRSSGIRAMLQAFEQAQLSHLPDQTTRYLCATALFSPLDEGIRQLQFETAQKLARARGMGCMDEPTQNQQVIPLLFSKSI